MAVDTFDIVQVTRQAVKPGMRPMPTSSAVAVLPVTADQIGQDAQEGDKPIKVTSLEEAFQKFKPKVAVKELIDGFSYELDADIKDMRGMTPEGLQKRQEVKGADGKIAYKANSLADLTDTINVLTRLKERWSRPQVRLAWADPAKREAILAAFHLLTGEMQAISKGESGGEPK